MRRPDLAIALLPAVLLVACGGGNGAPGLDELPEIADYCLAAQRVVTRTEVPMQLIVHEDFDAFVKSKAVIEGPEIQQYNWTDEQGRVFGISCKLKSADHLKLTYRFQGRDFRLTDVFGHLIKPVMT